MKRPNKWFVLWFTWLSWAWKTTVADAVFEELKNLWYINIDRLDWDIVRESLTKWLWFTKEDRDLNLERVWFVVKMLTKNGVWVLSTFISPYYKEREKLKDNSENFIEVFVNAPLATCEDRDIKWLYKKARLWEIQHFTWISDPYEEPQSPDIELRTDKETINESKNKVLSYLFDNWYLNK